MSWALPAVSTFSFESHSGDLIETFETEFVKKAARIARFQTSKNEVVSSSYNLKSSVEHRNEPISTNSSITDENWKKGAELLSIPQNNKLPSLPRNI